MAQALTQSDLIFPTQSLSFSTTLSALRRSALSIHNRLTSIIKDSDFAISVAEAYDLPLVANERCGSWYIPLEKKVESAYFKSTDGHINEWQFSVRRLNLQVLGLVGRVGGCVIVDSTRRGKSMPDALSKTIPIWCCVMNRAILPELGPHELYTSPQAVSASEHAQIEQRIDGFVDQFLHICAPEIATLKRLLQKPLRPIWVTQTSTLPATPPSFAEFHPVVLCTASRRVHGGEVSEGGYVQGAADDHEAWASGLTPPLFWSNKDSLLDTNEEDLPGVIAELLRDTAATEIAPILIKPTQNLYVASSIDIDLDRFDVIVSCTPEPLSTTNIEHVKTKKYLHLKCSIGKLGSRDLRAQLRHLSTFFEALDPSSTDILICCPTGKDLSVGVALAILCMYANSDGKISIPLQARNIDKTFIKQRLTWIVTSSPLLNPSRETLKAVNAFLMPDPTANEKAIAPEPPTTNFSFLDPSKSDVHGRHNSEHKALNKSPERTRKMATLPSRIFHALSTANTGPWHFTRKLKSTLPSHPSGTVTGTATITPHPSEPAAYIYAEEGEFVTSSNLRFTARRKYIYFLRPSLENDQEKEEDAYIAVHFHEENKKGGIGGLFVEMGQLDRQEEGVWTAQNKEQHLCGEDLYAAAWSFGVGLIEGEGQEDSKKWWEVRYDVKGPKKNYVSETRYSR